MYKFDSQSVEKAISPLRQAEESFRQVRDRLSKKNIRDLAARLDTEGGLMSGRKAAVSAVSWTQHLQADIKATIADYAELNEKGKKSLLFQGDRFSYGAFAGAAGLASVIGYENYQIYQFESSGKSLISDYNDMYSFRSNWLYESGQQSVSMSKWSDYGLMLGMTLESWGLPFNTMEEYSEDLLESAMGSILGGLPDLQSMENFETLDQLEQLSGIENLDEWISALKSVLSTYAKAGESFDEIELDEEFKKLMKQLPSSVRGMVSDTIRSAYWAEIAGDTISGVTDAIEYLDTCIDVIMHCLNDYSVQVSYLDTWEDALLAAGLDGGPVLSKIRELRENYQDDFSSYVLDKAGDLIVDEVKGMAIKEIIKKVAELSPVAKGVDLGLGLSSAMAQLEYADEISAVQGLDGLYQLDQNLTTSYQNYVDLMQEGIATEADMQEAERLFNLLKQTKINEYSHMLTLCEGHDLDLFNQYHLKYIELTGEPWKDYKRATLWSW